MRYVALTLNFNILFQKTGEAESITSHYLFALGSYRGLYIFNWIYRYYGEGKNEHLTTEMGIDQTNECIDIPKTDSCLTNVIVEIAP